ncbi:MAG: hypothetical protein R2792_09515 [Saprospiraceae bacterium]
MAVGRSGNEWVENVGAIALLDIKDVFSHVYVGCFPALMASMKGHPDTDNYQTALRLGFMEFGLLKLVQVWTMQVFLATIVPNRPFQPGYICGWLAWG